MEDGNFPANTAFDPIGHRFAWIPQIILDLLDVYVNRDGCRTPMQWDPGPNAGFCDPGVNPWLPVHENRIWANVQEQLQDDDSLLSLYRDLLHLRRVTPALRVGELELMTDPAMDRAANADILAYRRKTKDQTLLVVINFGARSVPLFQSTEYSRVLLSIGMEPPFDLAKIKLLPYSGIVLEN